MPDQHDFANMTAEDFEAWKAANAPVFAGVPVPALPTPVPPQGPTSVEDTAKAWSQTDKGYDFTTPLGHGCKLRDPEPQELLAAGILSKVNPLTGIAEKLVRMGEGLPPEQMAEIITNNEMAQLVDVLDTLMPLVVVEPKVWPQPTGSEAQEPGRVYPSMIDLTEKVAIMERTLRKVGQYANFRQQS